MTFSIESQNKLFQVSMNKDHLLQLANKLKSEFKDGEFVQYGKIPEMGDPFLTKEEYDANLQSFIQDIEQISENYLKTMLNTLPRKKNGMLKKNRIAPICECNNSTYICEWHNTWIYPQVYARVESENEVVVLFRMYTDTPA